MRGTVKAAPASQWGGLALALVLAAPGASLAQTLIPASGVEFDDAQNFRPTVDPGPFLSIYDSKTLARGRFSLGGWFGYALEPLDGRRRVGGQEENEAIVDNLVSFDLLGAIGISDRIQLGGQLPLHIVDEADVQLGASLRDGTSFNVGDLLLNAKFDLMGSDEGFGLAVVPTLGLPTGNRREFSGTGRVSYGGLLAADWRNGPWTLAGNFGGLIRDGFGGRDTDDDLEDQIHWGIGLFRDIGTRWALIGEVFGRTDASEEFHSPVELLGAARWSAGPVDLTFGIGGGVSSGKNAALFRFLVGVTAPREQAFAPSRREKKPAATPEPRGPASMASSRKTYVVEDHDRNGQVSPGDVIVYTINLVNSGAEAARNVIVVDPVPANTEFLSGTVQVNGLPLSDSAAYTADPPQVVVRVPSVGHGAGANQATITFKVRIAASLSAVTTVQNRVRVTAKGIDSFELPVVETAVFPAGEQRENVVQTTAEGGGERKLEVTEDIPFESGRATMLPSAYPVLDQVASILHEQPGMRLQIVGHTDSTGDELANLELSQERALAVREYLVAQGIDAGRLDASGRGEYEPVASNDTEAGRRANRRVEFRVVSP